MRIKKSGLTGRVVNRGLPKRLNWEHIEKIPRQEGRKVVKGTSKRVVVVKSPDPRFFEQAIFILKEDLLTGGKGNSSDVLREAESVANEYIKSFSEEKKSLLSKFPPPFFAAVGAVVGSLLCFVILSFV